MTALAPKLPEPPRSTFTAIEATLLRLAFGLLLGPIFAGSTWSALSKLL